jgi:hypothetical protein
MRERVATEYQIVITEKCCGDPVAAGFMPAFKLQPENCFGDETRA